MVVVVVMWWWWCVPVWEQLRMKIKLNPACFQMTPSTFQAFLILLEKAEIAVRGAPKWGFPMSIVFSSTPSVKAKPAGCLPSLGAQERRTWAARAMPSPPNPSRGLSPGARLAPRAAHLAPRRPRWRAAASDSAGSGASRIQSSWASPWWALALVGTRREWRMQIAGGWAPRGPSARAAVSAATAAGDRAPWFCVAGAPGSSRRRSLQRRGQPARPRAERPGGAVRVGQSGPPLFRVEGFPPAKRLTHCYSTPASLGTLSPGPVRRDSVRGRVSALVRP